MSKIAVAVIEKQKEIFLLRRAQNQLCTGFWEFPNCVVKNGERSASALRQALDEKFHIIPTDIGNLITSFKHEGNEIFAYHVEMFDESVPLLNTHVNDDFGWETANEALKYNLVPTARKIIMHITNMKEKPSKSQSLDSVIGEIVCKPMLDLNTNKYVVTIKNNFFGKTRSFISLNGAMNFYMETVREIIRLTRKYQYIIQR